MDCLQIALQIAAGMKYLASQVGVCVGFYPCICVCGGWGDTCGGWGRECVICCIPIYLPFDIFTYIYNNYTFAFLMFIHPLFVNQFATFLFFFFIDYWRFIFFNTGILSSNHLLLPGKLLSPPSTPALTPEPSLPSSTTSTETWPLGTAWWGPTWW